jgi:hypothetical protein
MLASDLDKARREVQSTDAVTGPLAHLLVEEAAIRTVKLDTHAARTDLTTRECAKILGGTIGNLETMTRGSEVRDAVRWWAGLSDQQWSAHFAALRGLERELGKFNPASGDV